MPGAIGIHSVNGFRGNLIALLRQFMQNPTHLKDVVENNTVGHQMVVLDALTQKYDYSLALPFRTLLKT